jgi:HD superfamily phosphodiesterase
MLLEEVMDNPLCQPVTECYKRWYEFMEKNVTFSFMDSEMHTKYHCARVLLIALVIAYQIGLCDEEMDVLSMAAIFHDSRRLDVNMLRTKEAAKLVDFAKYLLKISNE